MVLTIMEHASLNLITVSAMFFLYFSKKCVFIPENYTAV